MNSHTRSSWDPVKLINVKKLLLNRLCPGNHIAFSTLWLTAATTLATFNFSKLVDKEGKVIEPSCEYYSGMMR